MDRNGKNILKDVIKNIRKYMQRKLYKRNGKNNFILYDIHVKQGTLST